MSDRDVVNLCFHGIGVPGREMEPGEDRFWLGRDQFLHLLDEVAQWPSVSISFDDGNASDVQIGLSALVERGLIATFFLLSHRLDTPGSLRGDEVRELTGQGMTVGTHGARHIPWRGLDADDREREFVEARRRLSEIAGTPVEQAACPLGRYDRRLLTQLHQLRYARVFTSDRRLAHRDSWLQPRFSVRRDDTPQSLRETVRSSARLLSRLRSGAIGLAKQLR